MVHQLILRVASFTLFIHSINVHSFQVQDTTKSQENLLKSLQYELRDPSYRKKILPNNFNHLSNLISTGNNSNQPPAYLRSVVKLFSNLLKGAEYVNAQAFETFMDTFPTLAQPYFSLTASRTYITNGALYDAHMFDRFKATVNNVLYFKFSSDYDAFKQDPAKFLEHISSEILTIAQEEITREHVRQSIVRFGEITLNKLIWDVAQPEKSWSNVKRIADQLATLLEYNVLDDTNDLDDLYWTLITRYCYFLDLTATDIAPSFYTHVKHDLLAGNIILFELPEQDSIIETKLSYMQRTLISAEAQSRAHYMSMGQN